MTTSEILNRTKNLFLYKDIGPSLSFCVLSVVFLKILSLGLRKYPKLSDDLKDINCAKDELLKQEIEGSKYLAQLKPLLEFIAMCLVLKFAYFCFVIKIFPSNQWIRSQKNKLQNILSLSMFMYFSYLDIKEACLLIFNMKKLNKKDSCGS